MSSLYTRQFETNVRTMATVLFKDLCLYKNVKLTLNHIKECCQVYPDLRLQKDIFVFNDGCQKELLRLIGTIPITYKGSRYSVPISIWLFHTHPFVPPMTYITATTNMTIKPGKHVNKNRRILVPYLHDWKHPLSNLVDLVHTLTVVFSEEPPVHRKCEQQEQIRRPISTSHHDFIEWVTNAGLSDTTCEKLVSEELVTLRVLKLLEDSDLKLLALPLGQKRLLQLAIQELKST